MKAIAILSLVTASCAITRDAPARDVHYFAPAFTARAQLADPAPADRPRLQLRLGRVTAGDYLRYRIVHRTSDVELEQYQTRRWTERPEQYVRRALVDDLFGERPVEQAVAGSAPTLDVDVVAFEEVRAARPCGRVQLEYVLRDHHVVLASGVVLAERPVEGDAFADVVRAIGGALGEASARLADEVTRELSAAPAAQ